MSSRDKIFFKGVLSKLQDSKKKKRQIRGYNHKEIPQYMEE
jgi:hypothetical protein